MLYSVLQPALRRPFLLGSYFSSPSAHLLDFLGSRTRRGLPRSFNFAEKNGIGKKRREGIVCVSPFPVDPWAPNVDSESIASQLFAFSLFPYLGFLYFITKSKSAPPLTLFGFYFLLTFVGATIPAGIYAKVHYGTSLSNVDWLHGGAESLLTLTNLFIVLGLRDAVKKANDATESASNAVTATEVEKKQQST